MKNTSNRTKILLGVAIVVIVIAVAVIVLLPGSGVPLFGTAVTGITPANQRIERGAMLDLVAQNAVYNCNWFTSDAATVSIETDATEVKTVTVKGQKNGMAEIEARCGSGVFNVNHVTTTVTIASPPSITMSSGYIGVGGTRTVSTGDESCQWTVSGPVTVSPTSGASTTVTGTGAGVARVTATCQYGTASQGLAVGVHIWETSGTNGLTLDVHDTGMNCAWAWDDGRTVTGSPGQSVSFYSAECRQQSPCRRTITVTCDNGSASVDIGISNDGRPFP